LKTKYLLHPVLFVLSPVLSLYAYNIMRVHATATVVPALMTLAAAALVFGLALLVSKDGVRAALVTSLGLVLCFAFGPVQTSITSWVIGGIALARPTVLLAIWSTLFAIGAWSILRTRRDLTPLTAIVNVAAIGMIVLPTYQIIRYELVTNHAAASVNCTYTSDEEFSPVSVDHTPDIYFIVLDRYPSDSSLRQYFNYDNSDFTNYLEQHGFYVAKESYSNYIMTTQSLAATLNLGYLDCLTDLLGENTDNRLPMFHMLKDYRVWRFLKARGYQFIHAGTRWHVTGENPNADINYNVTQMPEFTHLFVQKTILFPILNKLNRVADRNVEKWNRVRHNFDKLIDAPSISGPKFVFGHFLVPHEPYVFDAEGEYMSFDRQATRTREENFVSQLKYTNRRVKELLDSLQSRSSTPPIIVVQADEGPYPPRTKALDFVWENATQDELREKTRILNAMYLPGADVDGLYPSITPVNTFRLIFNLYFDTQYPLLPDKCYAYADLKHLYQFLEVTEQVSN
jgi:hypothetical protein